MEPGRHLAPRRVRALSVSSNLTSPAKKETGGKTMSPLDWLDDEEDKIDHH